MKKDVTMENAVQKYENECIVKAQAFLSIHGMKANKKKIASVFRKIGEGHYGLDTQKVTQRKLMCIVLHRWFEAGVDSAEYFQAAMDTCEAEYRLLEIENKKRHKGNTALRKAIDRRRKGIEEKEYINSPTYKMRWWKSEKFYNSQAWRAIRYNAIERCNGKCQACGRTVADDVILHVDHIKPRSAYPELALNKSNLQVLCSICNLGKVNKYATNWMKRNETLKGGSK